MNPIVRNFRRMAVLPFVLTAGIIRGATGPGTVEILHPALGETVDSLENAMYRIFGPITGFSAARVYRTDPQDDAFALHLIRNAETHVQVLILPTAPMALSNIRNEIAARITAIENGKPVPALPVFAIEESKWVDHAPLKKVVLQDGGQLLGTFVQARRDTLLLRTLGGISLAIPYAGIRSITALKGDVAGGRWKRPDPNQSRLFFAPTGRPLQAGSAYFADYYIFFPTLAVGITDFLSASGGMSLIPGAESQLFYIAPKATIPVSAQIGLSAGFITLKVPEEKAVTLGYAVTTVCSGPGAFTFGAGLPFIRESEVNAIVLLGAETQISNSAKLITENWIFTGESSFGLLSGGIRFYGDELSVDLALITTSEGFGGEGFPFIPYVDFAVFF